MNQSRDCLTGSGANNRRGVAILSKVTVRTSRVPCGWEMSAEKYGRCPKCGAQWAAWQRPETCGEPSPSQ